MENQNLRFLFRCDGFNFHNFNFFCARSPLAPLRPYEGPRETLGHVAAPVMQSLCPKLLALDDPKPLMLLSDAREVWLSPCHQDLTEENVVKCLRTSISMLVSLDVFTASPHPVAPPVSELTRPWPRLT